MAKSARATAASQSAASKASHGTPVPMSNEQFADRVLHAARAVPHADRVGEKVFISDAYDAFARTPEGRGMTLHAFKARLLKLNRARKLDLGRADLVEAFDPATVARSAIIGHGTPTASGHVPTLYEFNFLRLK